MTLFKPDSIFIPDVALTLVADGDDAIIRKGIALIATEDYGIFGAGNGHQVTVAGTVQSGTTTSIILGSGSASTGNRLVVQAGGHVSGSSARLWAARSMPATSSSIRAGSSVM